MQLRTTICCSAFALSVALAAATLIAQQPPKPPARVVFKTTWTAALQGSLSAQPVYRGAHGFFPLDEGRLVAYDLTDGSEMWTARFDIHSEPAASEDLVFFADEGALTALHENDGSNAWRVPFAEPLAVPLVFDNGWLIAATTSGTVFAFRASDGVKVWHSDVGSVARARPALAADRVYIPAIDQRVIALQIESGKPVWERRLGGLLNDMLALDDRLYIGSDDNYLYCLKARDGVVDWKWPTGADVIGLPSTDNRLVYFVSLDNLLRGLDRKSGNQRWKRALPLRPTTGPVRAGDTLIVSGVAPMLRAFFAKDGTPAGDVATDGELAAPPYVLDDPETAAVIVVTRNIAKGAILSSFSRAAPPPPPATPPPGSTPLPGSTPAAPGSPPVPPALPPPGA